ncbi:MAG: hypothetical protein KI790_01385, partial [Cyclobacteriaceae bacterium]|nr:hypothetical protein [Cyclobacteriaceae bacterium HetDA_MAG_MS6]
MFDIGGVIISEPVTAITNILITLTCLYAFRKLRSSKDLSVKNWSFFFLTLGISAFVGAFGHLLSHYEFGFIKPITWLMSIFTVYFAQQASIYQLWRDRHPLNFFIKVQLVFFLILAIWYWTFTVVLVD